MVFDISQSVGYMLRILTYSKPSLGRITVMHVTQEHGAGNAFKRGLMDPSHGGSTVTDLDGLMSAGGQHDGRDDDDDIFLVVSFSPVQRGHVGYDGFREGTGHRSCVNIAAMPCNTLLNHNSSSSSSKGSWAGGDASNIFCLRRLVRWPTLLIKGCMTDEATKKRTVINVNEIIDTSPLIPPRTSPRPSIIYRQQ